MSATNRRLSLRSAALVLVIAAALSGVLFAVPKPPAEAAAPARLVDVHNPQVPHDVPAGADAGLKDLAIFAWQEFVALNWPALDPATTGVRGRPDLQKTFSGADPGLPVWQTYRHKNELFPASGATDPQFDSKQPAYSYPPGLKLTPATQSTSLTLWNNLDESSQIGLCTLFANNSTSDERRVLYEAKVNRAVFDYANSAGLTQPGGDYGYEILQARRNMTRRNLEKYGGLCSSTDSAKIVMLPCGDNAKPGDPGEGAIEIKAAWRKLTQDEMASGRFFTTQVIYYEKQRSPSKTIVHNDTYGLVGFHIIHKTVSFPAFVFATWEQVDAYDQGNTSGLQFHNIGTDSPAYFSVQRAHAIPGAIQEVTDDVHDQLAGTKSVWQYYKLVGVQGKPVDGPPPAGATADQISSYYLANIVVETNQTLQSFFGRVGSNGSPVPAKNLYVGGKAYQMGGCQGCHGFQGQLAGGDMSVLIGKAPTNSYTLEPYNADDVQMKKSGKQRFAQRR